MSSKSQPNLTKVDQGWTLQGSNAGGSKAQQNKHRSKVDACKHSDNTRTSSNAKYLHRSNGQTREGCDCDGDVEYWGLYDFDLTGEARQSKIAKLLERDRATASNASEDPSSPLGAGARGDN